MKLIVGLGNPGREYEWTRHNLGFLVLTHLAKEHHFKFSKSPRIQGLTVGGQIQNQEAMLLLPLTHMNHSGIAVQQSSEHKKIAVENILVVCDDFHVDFGQTRLRSQGSDGGHNGLTSIIEQLKTKNFARLRLGIGAPARKEEAVDFVLGEFSQKEKEALPQFIQRAAECCVVWLTEGITKAMGKFNKRTEDE